MWFKLQLNAFLPPLSILVGQKGVLYVKLIGIGALLQKSNPYEYRTRLKPLCLQAHQVLPPAGFDYPPQVLRMHVVPVTIAYSLIAQENVALGQLFLSRLTQGWAHKQGMRKFLLTESKAPTLLCLDEHDEKSVSVSLWIQDFIRDLELYRAEVGRCLEPSTRGDPGPSGEQPLAKRRRREETGSETLQEASGSETVAIKTEPSDSQESSSETLPSQEDIPVDALREDIPVDAIREAIPMDAIRENIPVDAIREDIPMESEAIREDIPVESNATREDIPVESDEIREPTTSQLHEATRPSTCTRAPETGGQDRDGGLKMMSIRLNPAFFTNQSPPKLFPEPGDVIVKLNAVPGRVWFMQGENEGLYWITTKRPA